MAKELPFFKFFVSEWNDGKIVDCSMEAQGLFINLCSLYWSRSGSLDIATAKRKLCQRYANAYKELVSAKIIKVSGGEISIGFLNEQFEDSNKRSEKNRQIALDGWKKRASALPTHSERIANAMPLREEKRREENKREDIEPLLTSINLFLQRKSQNTMDVQYMVQQWLDEGHTNILDQLKAMKVVYQKQKLVFPTRIETLTQSFMETDWIEKLKELDPEKIAENIQRNGTRKQPEPDTIGTSAPGSLG